MIRMDHQRRADRKAAEEAVARSLAEQVSTRRIAAEAVFACGGIPALVRDGSRRPLPPPPPLPLPVCEIDTVPRPRDAVFVFCAAALGIPAEWCRNYGVIARQALEQYVTTLKQTEPDARVVVGAVGFNNRSGGGARPLAECGPALDDARYLNQMSGGCLYDVFRVTAFFHHQVLHPYHLVLTFNSTDHWGESVWDMAACLREYAVIDTVTLALPSDGDDDPVLKAIASIRPDGSKRYRRVSCAAELNEHFRSLAAPIAASWWSRMWR